MIVVADTTPVNYLILIDRIDLLERLYGRVILPQAVREEMRRVSTPEKVRKWVDNLPSWVQVHTQAAPQMPLNLGPGEREVIALAVHLEADLVLMDDRKARLAAIERGLTVTGTLAILAAAARRGLEDLPAALDDLQQTTFRAPASLIRSILDSYRANKNSD